MSGKGLASGSFPLVPASSPLRSLGPQPCVTPGGNDQLIVRAMPPGVVQLRGSVSSVSLCPVGLFLKMLLIFGNEGDFGLFLN